MEGSMNLDVCEFNKSLEGKKVLILGLGVSNLPLIDYLYENKANIFVADAKELEEFDSNIVDKINKYNIKYSLGKDYMNSVEGFEINFRSPRILPTNDKSRGVFK